MDPLKISYTYLTVNVKNNCENVLITKPNDVIVTYRLRDPSLLISSLSFTTNDTTCGTLIFTCVY
jgi:hypothetical protein